MTNQPPCARDGKRSALRPDCQSRALGVAFFDLSRLSEWSSPEEDVRAASFLQEFYELAAEQIVPAGGRIVKFIGDAGLIVFEPESAEQTIFALCEFAAAARALGGQHGFDTHLNVNVHVGSVIAGSFGPDGDERFDVIGKTVNIAARFARRGVSLTAQAFRCLSEDGRKRFQKIKQPITYRFRG